MLRFLIALLPILLPCVVAPFLLDAGLLPGLLLLAIYSMILWGIIARWAWQAKEIKVPAMPVAGGLALLFIAWAGINISYTIAPPDALFWFAKWVVLGLFGLGLSILLATRENLQRPLLKGIIISAITSSSVGIYQLIPIIEKVIAKPDLTYEVTGLLGHKNLFSSWLMLLLPLVLLAIYRLGKVWKGIGLIAVVLLASTIFLVQSRAVWVALFGALGIVMAILLLGLLSNKAVRQHTGRAYGKYILATLVVPLLAVVAFLVLKPQMLHNIKQRVKYSIHFTGPKNQDNETIKERLFLWEHTWSMITEKPIVGHGAGAWRILFPKYGLQDSRSQHGYIHFQRPHNDWLWVWAEYGMVGFVLWAGFWLAVVGHLIMVFIRQQNPQEGIRALLLLWAIWAFLLNSSFDFPMERSAHLGLMAIIVSMAAQGSRIHSRRPRRALPMFMIAMGTVCLLLFYWRMRGEALAIQAYKLQAAGNHVQSTNMAKEAQSFIYQIDGVSAPMAYYIGNNWLALQNNEAALAAFQQAYRQHPYHLLLLNNLGSTWQFMGENDSAKHYYRQAIQISPRFEEPLLNLGAMFFNDRNTDSAYLYLSTVFPDSKNPRYRPSIDAMLKVEVRLLKQNFVPDSNEWQQLDALEAQPEVLFYRYLKAWERKNLTYERLERPVLDSVLLARP